MRVLDEVREADKRDWQARIVVAWQQARIIESSNTASSDMPQTKADQKKKPLDSKIQAAKKDRIRHDKMWYDALTSPAHMGEFLGMPDVLGKPERPQEKSREERASEGMAAAMRALRAITSG